MQMSRLHIHMYVCLQVNMYVCTYVKCLYWGCLLVVMLNVSDKSTNKHVETSPQWYIYVNTYKCIPFGLLNKRRTNLSLN